MKNKANTLQAQQGVILIEIAITMLLVAIGLLGLGKLQAHVLQSNTLARQNAEAMALAQQQIENMRGFTVIAPQVGTLAYNDIATAQDSISGVNTNFARNWTVTDDAILDYKAMRMIVGWTSESNENKSIELTTNICEHDPVLSGKIMTPNPAGVGPES